MSNRYEIRTGRWGSYFRDTKHAMDLDLQNVLFKLNLGDDYHCRLVEYAKRHGKPVPLAEHEQARLDAIDQSNTAIADSK